MLAHRPAMRGLLVKSRCTVSSTDRCPIHILGLRAKFLENASAISANKLGYHTRSLSKQASLLRKTYTDVDKT